MIAKNLYYKNMIEIAVNNYLISSPIAERTRDLYRHYLFKFIEWAVENDVELETAQAADVAAWFAEHKSWSASTKHTASAAIREFYRFQYGETHTMTRLKVKRTDPGPQRTLDEEETLALMAACEPNTPKGIRDLAIIALMTDTGLRATEIATAKLSRLDIRNSRLGVRIKGGDMGDALFFEYTSVCLANWLAARPYVARPDTTTVFCSIGGKSAGAPLTRFGIRMILESIARKAGVDHVTPHSLRRTFATLAIEKGAPTILVKEAGRWKSEKMVGLYARRVKPEKIRPYSPVDNIMGINPANPQDSD